MFLTPTTPALAMAEAESDALSNIINQNRYKITHTEQQFTGEGVDWLLQRAQQSQFFLIGEEHGIAENPLLAAQLFESLTQSGYQHLAIEVSPPMASHLSNVLSEGGIDALKRSYSHGTEPAFFGMTEEAQLLARVQAASSHSQAFWGLDYEVAGDKVLLNRLTTLSPPSDAQEALDALIQASQSAWLEYDKTNNPQFIFTFSGDPQLVQAVMEKWPDRPQEAEVILNTLFETLSINQHWVSGQGYLSNQRRAKWLQTNFIHYWRDNPTAKVMVKLGASHIMRGVNSNYTYDVGSVVPTLAAINNNTSFSILVLPGAKSNVAVLDPTQWRYRSAPAKDGYIKDMEHFYQHAHPDGFTVFDLTPLRNIIFKREFEQQKKLRELVMQFDAVLIMTGSTPSAQLVEY